MSLKNKINLIISISSLFIFICIAILVLSNSQIVKIIDTNTAFWINDIRFPVLVLNDIMLSITKIGNVYESLLIFLVLSIILIAKRKKISFYTFVIATSLGVILPELIKNLTERIRPESFYLQETSFSFPSGHTTISIVFLISSFLLFAPIIKSKFSRVLFLTISTIVFPAVAFSRIYLGVHWTTDVLAGICLGIFCFSFAKLVCCQKK
jgi:undecaprenyl-diphosphatase